MGAGGIATCETCGMEYTADRMREKIAELKGGAAPAPVPVVDNTAMIDNYLEMARNAKETGNNEEAVGYCNKIIELDLHNWEAWFIKGKAVGWQSTLANNRTGETINAFITALEHCPEERKESLGKECEEELVSLYSALLSLRVKNFKTHPNQNDMNGLNSDVQSIVLNMGEFMIKSGVIIEVNQLKYARIMNNGLCDAWAVVYKDYKGDGHPSDYDLTRFISEGDFLIDALKLALIFCDDDDDNKPSNDLRIQIYENLVHMNSTIRTAQSYEVDFSGGYKHYNPSKSLTDAAKRVRQNQIDEWNGEIRKIKGAAERKAQAAAKKRFDEYWEAHADLKAELEAERETLKGQVADLLAQEKVIPGTEEAKTLSGQIEQLSRQRDSLGLFKGKEKKALQEQIDGLQVQLKAVNDRIAAARAEIAAKLKPLNKRLDEIKTELTKPR